MPFFTLQIGADGPVLTAAIAVSKPRAEALTTAGEDVPAPVTIRALVDTGAGCTCVDPSILTQLDISPTGQVMMITPSTGTQPHPTDQYDVGLMIPGRANDSPLVIPTLPVAESDLMIQGIQALIGRDILNDCHFTYNGTMAMFTLAF